MKIINIASDDKLEDILDSVKKTHQIRVILVVPRSNPVFKSKTKAQKLKEELAGLKKELSILISGKISAENARLAGFDILEEKEGTLEEIEKDVALEEFYSAPPSPQLESVLPPKIHQESKVTQVKDQIIDAIDARGMKRFIVIFLGSAIFAFAFLALNSLEGASIKITPRKDSFSLDIPVAISKNINQPDPIYSMIPGQAVEFEKTITKTFASTGEKEVFQKAKGKITIYNNFGTEPQILVATTRFQTQAGLVFRIPQTITIPGAQRIQSGLKPGEIQIEAIADRAGLEYNIGPVQFTIPGFLGTPKYQGFYAKSFDKFSGGFIGKAKFVTKGDIEAAQGALKEELLQEVKEEIAGLGNLKVLDEAVSFEIEITLDSNKAGDIADEFNLGLKGKIKTIAFKESDVAIFINQYLKNSQNLIALEKTLKIEYSQPKLKEDNSEISLKLISSGEAVFNFSKEKIIGDILGRKSAQIEEYFNGLSEVQRAQISLSPFWKKSVPQNPEKVKIEIEIDQ